MATWPLPPLATDYVHATRSGSNPAWVNATCGAANVKGAWVSVIDPVAAGGGTTMMLHFNQTNVAATDTACLLDIGFGPSGGGSELVVVGNLLCGFLDLISMQRTLPLWVPPGIRVSARAQSVVAAKTVGVAVDVLAGEFAHGGWVPAQYTDYGVDTANSGGTTVTASGTANVKGAWAPLTTSTTAAHNALLIMVQGSVAVQTTAHYLLDVGVGAGGSEVVIVPDWHFRLTSSEQNFPTGPAFVPLGTSIPAGTRLSARVAAGTGSLTAEVVVHGIN